MSSSVKVATDCSRHNHKAFIIGVGHGYFRWPDVETAMKEVPENFNVVNPPLRDGARLAKGEGSWTVIRYQITFPAMSMLHCKLYPCSVLFVLCCRSLLFRRSQDPSLRRWAADCPFGRCRCYAAAS